jgi:hypothetical protein
VTSHSDTLAARPLDPDRPWVGSAYRPKHSVFVLGESYAGSYDGESEYDDFYWQQCLEGRRADPLFDALQAKLGIPASKWWPEIAFTNLSFGSIGYACAPEMLQRAWKELCARS